MRYITWPLLALTALLFLALGANEAKASPFFPTFSATLSTTAPGATSNVAVTYGFGLAPDPNRSFPASATVFTPGGWNIPDCSGVNLSTLASCPYPIGNLTGSASSTTTFGLFSGAYAVNIPIFFPGSPASTGLLNASTDPSDFIPAGAGFANLIADVNPSDGIMDGAQHWKICSWPSACQRPVSARWPQPTCSGPPSGWTPSRLARA